eukprot:CAMPEP_0181066400 /NCGR_PEP_ID=MMETSP1070-20121207/25299_1 /TAXON_ID=265543 /ORGANISM="Minutocellus polymorphus, Strain NH13" /LENGTH=59 /DNA_ID=CAMNT_0023146949 /DNA_START=20 /DNA_END=197 /DNA_ORIENTATION=+
MRVLLVANFECAGGGGGAVCRMKLGGLSQVTSLVAGGSSTASRMLCRWSPSSLRGWKNN